MAIKIEMLRCFVTVANCGNLADAADRLGRTPSAVSMMLKQFEAHLGEPLFEAERKSKLNPLGAFVLREATRELEHFDNSVAAIENYARAKSGFVRVAAVPSVAEAILPGVVRGFSRDYPHVRIDIRDMDSGGVVRELERDRVDLGIASGAGASGMIDHETLFSDAFGVICRVEHPLADLKRPLDWSALVPWPFIANGLCNNIADETFLRVFSESQLMVRNTTSLLAMVRAGVGVTVLPRLVVGNAEQELVFLPIADPLALRRIELLRCVHATLAPAARNFEHAVRRAALGFQSVNWIKR